MDQKRDHRYVHSVDHEVPNASLEWDVGSVGCLLHLCWNSSEEKALQADRLIIRERRL